MVSHVVCLYNLGVILVGVVITALEAKHLPRVIEAFSSMSAFVVLRVKV